MSRKYLPALIVSIATLLTLPACSKEPPAEEPLRPVRAERVVSSGDSRVRTFTGSAQAAVQSKLSFRVSGKVERVPAKVGDLVRAGQVLVELDPTDYELQVQDAEAALDQARAQVRNARAELERVRGLYENNNASQNELDASRAAYETFVARAASQTKRLELARNELGYTKLRAPVRGAVADVKVEENENVAIAQEVLLLASGARLEVEIAVPEFIISQIERDQIVEVRFDALPDEMFEARVTEVGIQSVGLATTFPVTVRLTSKDRQLRPGMAAEVRFRFSSGSGSETFFVPAYAVGEDREGRYVFILTTTEPELGVVRRRSVKVGDLTPQGIEILEGLKDGEMIVTAGVSRLQDGMPVKIPKIAGTDS
ncbi:MAG: efflux RND transporter periplasmic adaptor subunit [Acidobacteria bacterium]|nr:efflux RND transporter periplasmic adaptor subunit [Acidobacteriota bacterium]